MQSYYSEYDKHSLYGDIYSSFKTPFIGYIELKLMSKRIRRAAFLLILSNTHAFAILGWLLSKHFLLLRSGRMF